MARHRGRVVRALAAKLQAQFPAIVFLDVDRQTREIPLRWLPEQLYPATGAYRTDTRLDCWRWEGWAQGVKEDGSTYSAWAVGGYTRMSDLIRPGELTIAADGEVTIEPSGKVRGDV